MATKKSTSKKTTNKGAAAKTAPKKKASSAKTAGSKTKAAGSDAEPKKLSALDAAAKVLAETGEPMNSQELITAMAEKNYWTSPGGKTPHATLYAAIVREITTKGNESRFQKTERGKFALKA